MTRGIRGTGALAAIALLAAGTDMPPNAPKPQKIGKPKLREHHAGPYRPPTEKAISHAARADLCAHYGVPNTGRQWRKLRKRLGLAVRRRIALPPTPEGAGA